MSRTCAARRAALAAAAGLAVVGAALPARAADTLVTFSVTETAGTLSISAPPTAALGSTADGTRLSGALGQVTVTDSRGSLVGGWASDVWATDASRQDGTGQITARALSYRTGTVTTVPQSLAVQTQTADQALGGSTPVPAVSSVAVGKTQATWNPTLRVDVPVGTPAGTYGLTLTHSVS